MTWHCIVMHGVFQTCFRSIAILHTPPELVKFFMHCTLAHNTCSSFFYNIWQYNQPSSQFTKMQRILFVIGVKQHVPSNKPTNNISSFGELTNARQCSQFWINISKTQSKADKHSQKSGSKIARGEQL